MYSQLANKPNTEVFSAVQAKETLARQQPPEVRILKHLLTVESQQDMRAALEDAFNPGADLSTDTQDLLST